MTGATGKSMSATDAGRKWLELSTKERLKRLLDEIKKASRRSDLSFIPPDWSLSPPAEFDEAAVTEPESDVAEPEVEGAPVTAVDDRGERL